METDFFHKFQPYGTGEKFVGIPGKTGCARGCLTGTTGRWRTVRIAICEDDEEEREQLVGALRGWDSTRSAELFPDGDSLLKAAVRKPHFSIAFLDIYLPGENGMDIAERLRKISPETGIVFVTTSTEHAVQAFSMRALHYLVKPVTTRGVVEAFRRLSQFQMRRRSAISLTSGRDSYTVYQDEIYCLESFNHTVEITLVGGRVLKVREPLRELEQKLDQTFLKINRGTVVNMEHIEQMSPNTCILRSGKRLAVTGRKHGEVQAAYNDFLFSRLSERGAPEAAE